MNLFALFFSVLIFLVSADGSRVGGRPRKLLWLDADIAGTIGDIAGSLGDIDIVGQLENIDLAGQLENIDLAGLAGQIGDFLGGILGNDSDETEPATAAPSKSPTPSPTNSPTVEIDDASNSTIVSDDSDGGSRSLVSEVGLVSAGEILDEAMVDEGSETEIELDNAETDIEDAEGARKVRRGLR